MKKVILLAAVAVMAVFSANAQGKWYIGTAGIGGFQTGGVNGGDINSVTNLGDWGLMTGFGTTKDFSVWGIAPEIGYNINNDWSVGLGLGITSYKPNSNNVKAFTSYGFNPYVRWFAWRNNNFAFYAQGDIQFAGYNHKVGNNTVKNRAFSIAVLPGIAYTFNDHFSMTASIGQLGYSQASNNASGKMKSDKGVFGLNIDSGLNFGLTYTF